MNIFTTKNLRLFCSQIFFVFALMALPALAHNKVVVVPMSGDDLKPLKNIVSVAKENGDFSDPIAAMNSIGDANAGNPYLVVIAPGLYDLGANSLTLKPYVFVQGSGKDITTLRRLQVPDQESAVTVVGNSTLSDVTVISSATINGDTAGIIGTGEGFRIQSCKIEATNPSFRASGFALAATGGGSGVLDDVDIIVAGINDRGLGSIISFSPDPGSVQLRNSHISVLSTGRGIATLQISSGGGAGLLVTDTLIELFGAGIGVSNTDGNKSVYHHLTVRSSAANAKAFSGAGSGFRPNVENSRIELTGAGSIAFSTNNGHPRIRNSFIQAAIGFTATSAFFTPTYRVDNSLIDANNAVFLDIVGGELNIFIGSTQLDSSINMNQVNGIIDVTCVGAYNEQYVALDAVCN